MRPDEEKSDDESSEKEDDVDESILREEPDTGTFGEERKRKIFGSDTGKDD